MRTNLSHQNNKQATELVQYQRISSMWANSLSLGKLTRCKVNGLISEYPPEARPVLKEWLNTYRNMIRENQNKNQNKKPVKRRVVPHWVKR